jgi:hypothetical protein
MNYSYEQTALFALDQPQQPSQVSCIPTRFQESESLLLRLPSQPALPRHSPDIRLLALPEVASQGLTI